MTVDLTFDDIDSIRRRLPKPSHSGEHYYYVMVNASSMRNWSSIMSPLLTNRITLQSDYNNHGELKWGIDVEVTSSGLFRVHCS